ncbi:hypothetical protein D9M70_483370 [compost metagenome]
MVGVGGVGHRGAPPRAEQLDGEVLVGQPLAADEYLLDLRQALQGQTAQHAGVDRHLAPADQLQAGGEDLAVHVLARGFGLGRILVEEHHADRVLLRQLGAERFTRHGAQEQVRLLDQQPATVAGLAVGVDAAAMGHAGQCFDGGLQQVMTRLTLHMGDQTKAAVILELIRMK